VRDCHARDCAASRAAAWRRPRWSFTFARSCSSLKGFCRETPAGRRAVEPKSHRNVDRLTTVLSSYPVVFMAKSWAPGHSYGRGTFSS
jgi:hypothetical protein